MSDRRSEFGPVKIEAGKPRYRWGDVLEWAVTHAAKLIDQPTQHLTWDDPSPLIETLHAIAGVSDIAVMVDRVDHELGWEHPDEDDDAHNQ